MTRVEIRLIGMALRGEEMVEAAPIGVDPDHFDFLVFASMKMEARKFLSGCGASRSR